MGRVLWDERGAVGILGLAWWQRGRGWEGHIRLKRGLVLMGNKARQDVGWLVLAVTCSGLWAGSWRTMAPQWFCGICVAWLTLWWLNFLLFLFIQVRRENSWDNKSSSTGNQGDTLAQRATHPGKCISDTLSAALQIFYDPHALLSPSHEPVCLGLLWPGRLRDVYLSPDLRHKVPTGPPHYVTLYTDASCWEFKGLEGGVTGWAKVTAKETWLKERLEPSSVSQWPTSMVHWQQWWMRLCPLHCCRIGR